MLQNLHNKNYYLSITQQNQPDQQMTRKERRAERREEEKEKQKTKQKKIAHKKTAKLIISLLIFIFAGYGLFLLVSRTTTPKPGQPISIQGREHIPVGAPHPEYNSNPPTSGSHYDQPENFGVYQEELRDETAVHNLEHGGIWISYHPDIDEKIKEKIEDIGEKYSGSVVVSPRSANDSPIALASWGRLEKLSSFDEDRIIEFIKRNKNKSPEPLAR